MFPVVSLWFKQTVVVLVWPVKVQLGFLEIVGEFLGSSLQQTLLPCLSTDAKSVVVSLWSMALSALESILVLSLLQ